MLDRISAFLKSRQGFKKQKQHKQLLDETGYTYLVLNKAKNVPFDRQFDDEVIVDNLIPKIEDLKEIGYYSDISEGLLLLSTDDSIETNHLETEYVVKVDKVISSDLIKKLSEGVQILNLFMVPKYIEKIDNHHFRIALNETMLNQVKRMTEAYGYHAIRIMRVRIDTIVIDGLRKRKFRYLTIEEINKLKREQIEGEQE